MLIHGRQELTALADSCAFHDETTVDGWQIDTWSMTDDDVGAAIATYEAVLTGDVGTTIANLLSEQGFELRELLIDGENSNDQVTRADVCELTSAASLVAKPSLSTEKMFMPNVPKMSRRKSESGFDIVELILDQTSEELLDHEHLTIVSVKHTTNGSTAYDLRRNLVESVSREALTPAYVVTQLKVLSSKMRESGIPAEIADRIYLFLRDFKTSESVQFYAIGVIDPDLVDDLKQRIESLPVCTSNNHHFRIILLPGLRTLHERCP
jgi:hypothetical protein